MSLREPKIIIHGGAGRVEGKVATREEYRIGLHCALSHAYEVLTQEGARSAVKTAIRIMESNPVFNAGTGSKLQQDGRVRMSAAIMDSSSRVFSGVINIQDVEHPIDVADQLCDEPYEILSGYEATEFARRKGFKFHDPVTLFRFKEYQRSLRKSDKFGTVGAVAMDADGIVCSGTSTGGVGYETPGRVGDSATVAGTYADSCGGVSCTGRGEHIISAAAAVHVVVRLREGVALKKILKELSLTSAGHNHQYGLIALDGSGQFGVKSTSRKITVLHASRDADKITDFTTHRSL